MRICLQRAADSYLNHPAADRDSLELKLLLQFPDIILHSRLTSLSAVHSLFGERIAPLGWEVLHGIAQKQKDLELDWLCRSPLHRRDRCGSSPARPPGQPRAQTHR